METQVDFYRVPDRKDLRGWRGPCDFLDVSRADNQTIVKYQSTPFIVPLRHMRPHLSALFALFSFNYMWHSDFVRQNFPTAHWPTDLN